MANAEVGQVPFTLGEGKGAKSFVLQYSVDALCALETLLNKDVTAIGTDLQEAIENKTVRLGFVRSLLWAGLRENQPAFVDPVAGLRAAGELLREPGADKAMEQLATAFRLAFPNVEDAEGMARPPAAPAVSKDGGTGAAS